MSLVISRQLLTDISAHIKSMNDSNSKLLSHFILEKVCTGQSRIKYKLIIGNNLLNKFRLDQG